MTQKPCFLAFGSKLKLFFSFDFHPSKVFKMAWKHHPVCKIKSFWSKSGLIFSIWPKIWSPQPLDLRRTLKPNMEAQCGSTFCWCFWNIAWVHSTALPDSVVEMLRREHFLWSAYEAKFRRPPGKQRPFENCYWLPKGSFAPNLEACTKLHDCFFNFA